MLGRLPREVSQRLRTRRGWPLGFMSCGSCESCGVDTKGLQAAVDRHEATVTRLHSAALATSAGTPYADPPRGAADAVSGRPLRDDGSSGPAESASEPSSAPHARSAARKILAPVVPPPLPLVGDLYSKTFYKRALPSPPAIAFSSPEGDPGELISHSWADVDAAALMCVVTLAIKHATPHVRREAAVW